MMPLVSVIVINRNGEEHLAECLGSLERQTYRPIEILVVDNGSTDGSQTVVRQFGARWEPLGRNMGFARGNNEGARRARGDILLFVNNDMRFDPTLVGRLVKPLMRGNSVFATDARQFDWAGEREVHLATRLRRLSSAWAAVRGGSLLPRFDLDQFASTVPCRVLQASAANLAVSHEKFEALGGFDARFPIGWEDTDICWRAWLNGWSTIFVPDAVCWHKVGMSAVSRSGAWFRWRGALGGRLLFTMKHLPAEDFVLGWSMVVAALITDIARLDIERARHRAAVLHEFTRYIPATIKERRARYGASGLTPRRHLRFLCALEP